MAAPEIMTTGEVSRILPQPVPDTQPERIRIGRTREQYVLSLVRKQHLLADEGGYFVANNSGTGIATAAAPTAFSDTAPLLTVQNVDAVTNLSAKRIYLDWIRLTQTAAGTAGTDLRLRAVLDTTTPSGGTSLTPVNANMDVSQRASVSVVRLLGTGVAQSGNSRVVVGTQVVIPTMTAPLAALSEIYLNIGGVETAPYTFFNGAASANPFKATYPWPPIIIGPQQCFMLEFLITAQSAASSWTVELGWWER